MKNTRKEKIEIDYLDDIICNMCSSSCRTSDDEYEIKINNKNDSNFDYLTISGSFGYNAIEKDGESWSAHICLSCADILDKQIAFNKKTMFGGKKGNNEFNKITNRKMKINKILRVK